MKDNKINLEESQIISDKNWVSDDTNYTNTLQNSFELKSLNNLHDQQNLESRDFCETYSAYSDQSYQQLQIEGYEMEDLLEKFDNISKNNISKNIIKAFFSYLLDTQDNDLLTDFVQKGMQISQARKMAKNYFKSYSFNNNSLHKLIQHPKYGKAFEFYLTFEAEKWLAESKVQEKKTHLIYIDFLKLCCSNPKYSDHLVTYKKSKKSKFNDKI